MSETPSHICDTGNFDRTVCPEPCGWMHSYCRTCGERQDPCAHETGRRTTAALVHVGDGVWLNPAAVAMVSPASPITSHSPHPETRALVTLTSGDTREMPADITVDDVVQALGGGA